MNTTTPLSAAEIAAKAKELYYDSEELDPRQRLMDKALMNGFRQGAEWMKEQLAALSRTPEVSEEAIAVLKECDDYLNEETWDFGEEEQLNSIDAGSILHRKIKSALQYLGEKKQGDISTPGQ